MKLNLGCGDNIKPGWLNHDLTLHSKGIDCIHDLDVLPWPWADNSMAVINSISVFEHLKLDLIQILNECWRILKPRGILYVKYPVFTSPRIHDDPTHRWQWSQYSFDFVDQTTNYGNEYWFYTPNKWTILKKEVDRCNCKISLRPIKESS